MISFNDKKTFYAAHLARDRRFDGKFFVAVKSTKIYCRPICPARKAKLENLDFYIHAAEAEERGFRPCFRCRPETAPGSPAWVGTSSVVRRAIRIMDAHAQDDLSMAELSSKLGVGDRWLRELFQKQVGASPQTVLTLKRLDIARSMLDDCSLSITDVAYSSGFQSLRRFNDAFKCRFKKTPRDFKKLQVSGRGNTLHLSYRPPFAWNELLDFFKFRAIPGLEQVDGNSYRRLITLGDARGWFLAKPAVGNSISIDFEFDRNASVVEFAARIRNIFDLDADPTAIQRTLWADSDLRPLLKDCPGLRVPGCWDGFEIAVRAIIGQQISVKGALTILTRLVTKFGDQSFPTPETIAKADLAGIGLTNSRIATLKNLASEVAPGNICLDETADSFVTCQNLLAIKGIGPWTVEYIAMRALRNPNAFPETDLELRKQISKLKLDSRRWQPWRAYGAMALWRNSKQGGTR